jgi:NAD(P)-dependent dehydrogenase (short-subunit alcohol dehydrogenase family)
MPAWSPTLYLTMDEWDWQRTLDVNLSGPFYDPIGRPDDARTGGGAIVNIASIAGVPTA